MWTEKAMGGHTEKVAISKPRREFSGGTFYISNVIICKNIDITKLPEQLTSGRYLLKEKINARVL